MATVTRRRFVVGICLAAAIPVLQACRQAPAAAPQPATSTTPPPTALAGTTAASSTTPVTTGAPVVNKNVEIGVATRGATDGDIMENSVKTFFEQSGITVKHVSYGPEPEYWAKVQALHATGQVADVIWASTGNLHNFANRGILAELDPLIKADNYDMSDYIK